MLCTLKILLQKFLLCLGVSLRQTPRANLYAQVQCNAGEATTLDFCVPLHSSSGAVCVLISLKQNEAQRTVRIFFILRIA